MIAVVRAIRLQTTGWPKETQRLPDSPKFREGEKKGTSLIIDGPDKESPQATSERRKRLT